MCVCVHECVRVCKFMQATECSQACPTKTPPPLISSPIWNTLIHRELYLSFSLPPYPSLCLSLLTHFSLLSLSLPLYLWFTLTGPSRKPKYVESPRIPSDAIASALRKVADNKESKQNGESSFRSVSGVAACCSVKKKKQFGLNNFAFLLP